VLEAYYVAIQITAAPIITNIHAVEASTQCGTRVPSAARSDRLRERGHLVHMPSAHSHRTGDYYAAEKSNIDAIASIRSTSRRAATMALSGDVLQTRSLPGAAKRRMGTLCGFNQIGRVTRAKCEAHCQAMPMLEMFLPYRLGVNDAFVSGTRS
jgi:hypothetical protein